MLVCSRVSSVSGMGGGLMANLFQGFLHFRMGGGLIANVVQGVLHFRNGGWVE